MLLSDFNQTQIVTDSVVDWSANVPLASLPQGKLKTLK
jgi:hypothetical protein